MSEQKSSANTQEELQKKLEESFGILMTELAAEEVDEKTLQGKGYWKLPQDVAARLSPLAQTTAGMATNQAVRGAFRGAVKIVVPADLPLNVEAIAAPKLGPGVDSLNFRNKITKKFVGQGGVQGIDAVPADIAQAAYGVFSLASVVTGQYFMQRIDRKMENIQKNTDNILQFLELDKQSDLLADQMFLSETAQDLEDMALCEPQRQAALVNIQATRKKAMKEALFYGKRIKQLTDGLFSKKYKEAEWQETKNQLLSDIASYQLSLGVYGRSIFLEVMLTGNTEQGYLDRLLGRMEIQQDEYEQSLKSCCKGLMKYAKDADPHKVAFIIGEVAAAFAPVLAKPLTASIETIHSTVKKDLKDKLSKDITELAQSYAKAGLLQNSIESVRRLNEISNKSHEPTELIIDEKGQLYMKEQENMREQVQTA